MAEKSYKLRIYPNKEQEILIHKTFGCARYVFNRYLSQRIEQYEETGKSPSRFAQDKQLTELKKELIWLKEVDSAALQSSLQNVDTAYRNFFRRVKQGEEPGFPRFKSRQHNRKSYKSKKVGNNIAILDKHIKLPKLGLVKCRISKQVEGRILSATVGQNPSGKYFVSTCCTDVDVKPMKSTGAVVGVDLGLKDFAITSDGDVVHNPRYPVNSQK